MNKDLIKKRFSKSLSTYNHNAKAQKIMAKTLTEYLNGFNFKSVLELGCGTGFVTKILFKDFLKYYDTVDIVDECQEYIEMISPKIKFISADIENFVPTQKYDLIISNAVVQWLDNMEGYIHNLNNFLNENGKIAFTIFGKENYKELTNIVKNPIKYYSVEEIIKMFGKDSIEIIEENKIVLEFDTPREILYHIKKTGVNALSENRFTSLDLKNFEKECPKGLNGQYILTYNPIYVVLVHK